MAIDSIPYVGYTIYGVAHKHYIGHNQTSVAQSMTPPGP